MGLERGGQETLHQFALRARLHAHPVFLLDDFAFLVKLAKYRVQEPLRFQQEPQFQAVRRQAVIILRGIIRRPGVQAHTAVFLDDPRVFVGNHVILRPFNRRLNLFGKHANLGLIRLGALVLFGLQAVIGSLDGIDGLAFLWPVSSPDGLRSLERHVLEHMGDPGLTGRVVYGTRINVCVERNNRRFVAFRHYEM
jgi:hypothetical protein